LSRETGFKNGAPQSKTIGTDRLVSMEKLPDMGGEFCEPVSTASTANKPEVLMAALQQRQDLRATAAAARSADTQDRSKLKPIRWIRDPYAAFSSIAVDP